MSDNTVKLKSVVKRYGKTEIVHGINLDIHDNEFIVLVGPSGCGKSTTLRMIAGLEEISDGQIEIAGKVVNDIPPKDRNIAMVFQNYALYPHMTVENNMSFGLKMKKTPKPEIKERVNEASEVLGLHALLERKPAALSGGQRQRVAMGRAIVRNPKVFLFDEPLSNLDAKLRIQMRTEIKKLHNRINNTVVYVTHDQVEAMTLADRIVVMRDGYIEQVGTPIEIFNHPQNVFVAGFIGNPPMNLIKGNIKKEGDNLQIVAQDLVVKIPPKENLSLKDGQSIIMGIRPEDATMEKNSKTQENQEIQATIDVAEPLGGETLLHLNAGGNLLVGKSEGRNIPKVNDQVALHLNLDHLHIFDGETQQTIY